MSSLSLPRMLHNRKTSLEVEKENFEKFQGNRMNPDRKKRPESYDETKGNSINENKTKSYNKSRPNSKSDDENKWERQSSENKRGQSNEDKRMSRNNSDEERDMFQARASHFQPNDDNNSDKSNPKDLDESSELSKLGLIGEIDYFPANENDGRCPICMRSIRESQKRIRCDGDCRRSFHLPCTNLDEGDLEALSNPHLKWACSTSDCRLSGKAVARDVKALDKNLDRLLSQMESIKTESVAIRGMLGEVFDHMKSIRRELSQMNRPKRLSQDSDRSFVL